jgi:flagellar hook-associated protein 2
MSISSANYDPATTASQLATAYTAGRQQIITTQTASATATASALTKLRAALSEFSSSMATLSGKNTLIANAATFSNTSVGTATATKTATAGTYSFFVEKLAAAHQLAYSGLDTKTSAIGDKLSIKLGTLGTPFVVTLAKADSTPQELAAAINAATGNNSQVTASIMTINGASQLVLTANTTGSKEITLTPPYGAVAR